MQSFVYGFQGWGHVMQPVRAGICLFWLLLPSDKLIFAKIQQSQHDMESIFSFQADKPVYPFYPNYARLYVWEQPIICI